ncbi:---NA--- [Octopus vulgaris]|uniref:---NA n=1 Tax=Octopus vulgaris TaxID=6645 RepID=A0AA36FJD1_OCTVU|nr:---NA--- [Octopus vulgaris]
MSTWKIAEKIQRSRTPVDNFLKDPNGYNRVRAGGRLKATSESDEKPIVRVVKKSRCPSVSKIKKIMSMVPLGFWKDCFCDDLETVQEYLSKDLQKRYFTIVHTGFSIFFLEYTDYDGVFEIIWNL